MQNTDKIKLVIAVPSLACGGLEKNTAFLANNLNQKKFSVTVMVINNSNPFYTINKNKVRLIDLAAPGARKAMKVLIAKVNEINPDILLSASNHLNLLCAMQKSKFPRQMKLIARESSIVSRNVKYGKYPWLYNILLRKYYKKTDLIICQSEYMKADLKEHYGISEEKLKVINNAVEMPDPPSTHIPSHTVFLSVGRLRPEKGFEDMLRAVAKLTVPYKLHIVGDGPQKEKLKSLAQQLGIQNNLVFYGDMKNPFRIHEKPQLFLLTSQYEGFPNAVLEAGTLGIPAIAYNAPGGLSEIIKEGENGFLVSPREPEVFAKYIERGIQHPFQSEEIKQHTLSKFSSEKILRKWESLFCDLNLQR